MIARLVNYVGGISLFEYTSLTFNSSLIIKVIQGLPANGVFYHFLFNLISRISLKMLYFGMQKKNGVRNFV